MWERKREEKGRRDRRERQGGTRKEEGKGYCCALLLWAGLAEARSGVQQGQGALCVCVCVGLVPVSMAMASLLAVLVSF